MDETAATATGDGVRRNVSLIAILGSAIISVLVWTGSGMSNSSPASFDTGTPTGTPTDTPTNTATNTPTDTPTNTATSTPTDTPTDTPTNTPTNTPTDTPTNTPTNTPTSTPTDTPTNTPTSTPTDTPTSTPTNTPTNTPTPTPIPFEGCTPGYWKQKSHLDSWVATGLTPQQTLASVFGFTGSLGNTTLLQALSLKGGNTTSQGGLQILARNAVAALLNARHPDVFYALSPAQVVALVNGAIASGERSTYLAVAAQLDAHNQKHCPLT